MTGIGLDGEVTTGEMKEERSSAMVSFVNAR